MKFLLGITTKISGPEEVEKAFAGYREYLESIRPILPVSAYELAAATWHYDHRDHRCPHDSWVESLEIREPSSGTRHEKRQLEISIRLLGAFQDGYLELSYSDVSSYSLADEIPEKPKIGHGDWLIDEIRLSDKNLVLHEILFSTGSRWLIESRNIEFRWVPHP